MSAKKSAKKTSTPKSEIDENKLGELFEALRTYAEELNPDDSPHGRLFLLMLADRGDDAIGYPRELR